MNSSHTFSPEILKTCDIRGLVGEELNGEDAYFTGRAFGTYLVRRGITACALGYDGRLSSPEFCRRAALGLRESGVRVTLLGLVPTPGVYHAVYKLGFPAGLMVTASHNPPEYNGFKFITTAGPFHGDDIQNLARLSGEADFETGAGDLEELDIREIYTDYLAGFIKKTRKKSLKIVWDPGNGAAGAVLEPFLKKIPGEHQVICGRVDGTFPNHHPDPSLEKNVSQLRETVVKEKADLGIAFDGDGDRIGVVDGEGFLLYGDQLLTLYARDFLAEHPGETVMSEVKASRFFYEDVRARGGIPLMWKVGHTNQKEKMKQEGILLAGETSGHIFFEENGGYDDALFAAVKLINIISASDKSLAQLRRDFPVYQDSGEIRIHLDTRERARVIGEISKRLKNAGRQFIDLDGIRADWADGFWMMRSSNTQPHITIRCEAATEKGLALCLADMREQLELSGVKDSSYSPVPGLFMVTIPLKPSTVM